MDILELHKRALDRTGDLVAGIAPDQMTQPTPCTEWDVRAVAGHLVAGNHRFVRIAEGQSLERPAGAGDPLGDDPAGAYRASAEALDRAWRAPGRLDQLYDLPIGRHPGRAALGIHLVETVVHGWDLARATGQAPGYDPEVVRAASEFARTSLPAERPPEMPFANAVPIADDAPEIDRFAAFLGRRV